MATSTFGRQFAVKQNKAHSFVKEMTRSVTPTLKKNFHSKLTHLAQEKDLQNDLLKVLGK